MGDAAFMEGVRTHGKALSFHDIANPFFVKVSHHEIAVIELVRPMAPKAVIARPIGTFFR